MAKSGDVIEHPVTGERVTFLKTAAETNGESLQIELAVRPGGFVSAAHIHPQQSEHFAIRAGTLHFRLEGAELAVGPGGEVTVPAGMPHAWWNPGEDEVVVEIEFRPALDAEDCFESAFGLAQDGEVDPVTGMPNQPWLALVLCTYHNFAYPAEPPLDDLLAILGPIAEEAERQGYRMPYPYPYARQGEPIAV